MASGRFNWLAPSLLVPFCSILISWRGERTAEHPEKGSKANGEAAGASLQLLKLDVPSIADPRWDRLTLRCEYDLGGEDLYSVKWYKDGAEFFRYMPDSRPPGRDFPVDGVYVDVNKSDSKQVTLLGQANNRRGKVNLTGSYGCEVSSEGPSFLTIYGEANMSVAILPKQRPTIRGLRPSYEAGQTFQAECNSAASYPPAQLIFILNGKEVNKMLTKELPSVPSSEDSILSSTRQRLTLRLERHHFPGGTLTLTCQSILPGIVGAKPLERTETATMAASNQRLAQEPPRSSSFVNYPPPILIYCLLTIFGSLNRGNLAPLHV
ncbi:uncharacterized protein LOC108632931 isoform X2 [Ceratina calcarata]|uniref:Uncharacterized protein LOC108632931 isoform X2 n=1 Tax=Ceratina calcarata TaxID=156304 RepID=A0AAJ7W8U4_9HYME|nr:uncharacterized protein LOC108632931 isoform X2 [Ceratina calcarata]